MLEPDAIAVIARVQAWLERSIPEVTSASSAADLWRKAYRVMAPEQAAQNGGLPPDRATAAQLHLVFDDPRLTRNTLASDRGSAAVVAVLPNVDSVRGKEILTQLEDYLAAEEAATGYQLSATGLFANLADINEVLLDGMASSLAWALVVTFGVFLVVLRSARLALLAMIPNVLPLAIAFGFMGLFGMHITPSTVVVCAIVRRSRTTTRSSTSRGSASSSRAACARGRPSPRAPPRPIRCERSAHR
jgi:predicted RND superfamily exporter protein